MSSNSEASYGARIGNAEKLVSAVQTFVGYIPVKPEYSISSYTTVIDDIKIFNNDVATKKQNYSLVIDDRHQIFQKGQFSIEKILSPINTTVKAFYGKTSKEATDIAAIIAKIRGGNIKKSTKKDPDKDTVSQSYQSYNSKVQYFADLIAYLTNLGINYDPVNPAIKLAALNIIYANGIASNSEVMQKYSEFAQSNTIRMNSYIVLSQNAIRIKDAIKAQYGFNSTEYKLIKGLKI